MFVEELASIYDYVTPCFPPAYRIFTVVFREYHKQLDNMLFFIGCCSEQLANADILKVCCVYAASLYSTGVAPTGV